MLYTVFSRSSPVAFSSSGLFTAHNSPIHPRRCLDTYVLLFGCGGEYPIAQAGEESILRDGSFLLLRAGVEHEGTSPARGNQSHYWCHFYLSEEQTVGALPCDTRLCVLPTYFVPEHAEKYRLLFRQLIDAEYREYADPSVRQDLCNAFLRILLVELGQDCLAQQSRRANESEEGQDLIFRIKEWIRNHAADGIAPRDVALKFGYNADYLTQRFRRSTGMTVGEYISFVRIDVAKKLLLSTNLRVGELTERCGFRDQKYFLRMFRKAVGVTPSQYRSTFCHVHENDR